MGLAMMRRLFLLALFALAACDSATDTVPYNGMLDVSAVTDPTTGQPVLRLVAADDTGCGDPLVVQTGGEHRLKISVLGIGTPRAPCDALIPAAASVPLPTADGIYPVEIRHGGNRLRYVFVTASDGWRLLPTP